jgi:hypothetical protein
VCYYNATAGFPTQPTWIVAISKGYYSTWPGLTAAMAARHFPESNKTWCDHGQKIESNLRSTKKAIGEEVRAQTNNIQRQIMGEEGGQHKGEEAAHNAEPGGQDKSSELPCAVYHKVYNMQDNMGRITYTDQTAEFPVCSYRGMQYVMILLEIQSKSILLAGMRN